VRLKEPEVADATTRLVLAKLGIALHNWQLLLDVPVATLLETQLSVAPPMAARGGFSQGQLSI